MRPIYSARSIHLKPSMILRCTWAYRFLSMRICVAVGRKKKTLKRVGFVRLENKVQRRAAASQKRLDFFPSGGLLDRHLPVDNAPDDSVNITEVVEDGEGHAFPLAVLDEVCGTHGRGSAFSTRFRKKRRQGGGD